MARGQGGSRTANPGSMLPNRSDMRTTQAVQATSGGDYGSRKAQEEAQSAMPLENTAGVMNQQVDPAALPRAAMPFDADSQRPDEPLTTMPQQAFNLPDPAQQNLKQYLPALELMSTMPDTSQTTRNFIRRLRGSIG